MRIFHQAYTSGAEEKDMVVISIKTWILSSVGQQGQMFMDAIQLVFVLGKLYQVQK